MKKVLIVIVLLMVGCHTNTIDKIDSTTISNNPTTELNVNEFISLMENDNYAIKENVPNFGITDSTNIGVIKENIDTLDVIHDNYTYSLNFDSYLGDDTLKWNSLLEDLNGKENVLINLPNRIISLNSDLTSSTSYAMNLDNLNDVTILGGDNTLILLDTPTTYKGGISINNSKNIHLNSFSLDYKISPTFTGIVQQINDLTLILSIPSEQKESYDLFRLNANLSKTLQSLVEYDKYTLAPKENGNILIKSQEYFQIVELKDNTIEITFSEGYRQSFKTPRVGELFALGFTMYGNSGITINNSENIYIEGVKIYSAPGMGITSSNSKNLYFNRIAIMVSKGRLMSASADGIHISTALGDVVITNSLIENTHDDALNIKAGYYYSLNDVNVANRELIIAKKTSTNPLPRVNDIMHVYDSSTFALKGKFTVVESLGNTNITTLKVKEKISGAISWENCVVTNATYCPTFTFKNNIIQNKRNRGILLQLNNGIIENNTFKNIGHGSIQIGSSMDIYNEATIPDNITIRNNKFINNAYYNNGSLRGDISIFALAKNAVVGVPGTLKSFIIENNYIANTGNHGISLQAVKDTNILNNFFYNTCRRGNMINQGVMELENCQNILVKGNYNKVTLTIVDYAGVLPTGLTSQSDITLQDNYNIDFPHFTNEITYINVDEVSSSIVIDGNLDEWDNIGNSINIIGSSEATGEEMFANQYSSYFQVLTNKIAYTENGIYFALAIQDDALDFKTINDFWTGDVIEIFYSSVIDVPSADFQLYKEQGDVFQLAIAPTWNYTFASNRTNSNILSKASLIKVKAIVTDIGWNAEIFIPFTVIEKSNTSKAIAIVIGDADRDNINRKRLQVGNVPHFVENYKTKTAKMQQFNFN